MLTIEGTIINIDNHFKGRIEIDDNGIITKISEPTGEADISLADELIFPGFIDLHVHARESADHSWDYKEDFNTAGQAAVNGGVVAFADMPNNQKPPVDDESYEEKNQLTKKSADEVLLYAGIGPKTKPLSRKVPYKVFMGKSVGDLYFNSSDELESAISKYSGLSVSFHCEDPKVLEKNQTKPNHSQQRPPEAETSAIDFALEMIKKYYLKGKICHCSTAEGLRKIIEAKRNGLDVAVEVTPHHLYYDAENSRTEVKNLQVNPPIRQSKENRMALIESLKKGEIDYLATDHAPHTIEEKQKGISGMPHLDTYGPFAAWLMSEHHFSPLDIARVCSHNPGLFLNQFLNAKYGKIETGYTGSLTILDMSKPIKIEKSMLKTKCGWSPFEGLTFPGRVKTTIVRGKVYNH